MSARAHPNSNVEAGVILPPLLASAESMAELLLLGLVFQSVLKPLIVLFAGEGIENPKKLVDHTSVGPVSLASIVLFLGFFALWISHIPTLLGWLSVRSVGQLVNGPT